MLDWKIFAASFAALLFVSSMFVGEFGIGDFFTTITEKLGEWLGNSPFGGMLTVPTSPSVIDADNVYLKVYPDSFSIKPIHPVNITFGRNKIIGFGGEIMIDYKNKTIKFDESNSQLSIIIPIEKTTIHDLKLKKLIVDEEEMDVNTGDWEISSDNGSIEIYDFSGFSVIDSKTIEFEGNISKLLRI